MRLFYIQNESGARIPLNNETGIFFSEPEGLGLLFEDNFANIGEGFFKMVSKQHSQRVIGGKLNFMKSPYKLYNDFINWCMASTHLYFVYRPIDVEYYIHIEIESIEKGEINKLGYLEAPVNLRYLSPWYIPSPANISMIGEGISAFRWDLSKFGNSDILVSTTAEAYTAKLQAIGHLPAAVKISFYGIASKPVFKLVGNTTGIEYGTCCINKVFDTDTTLELSTLYEDSYIKCIDILGNEEDLLPYVDLTHEPFFKIPITEECTLTITDEETLKGRVTGNIYFYYRSV